MKYRINNKWGVMLVTGLVLILAEAKAAKESLQGSKPNIILVMTDDQ
jgi:hypothetical protein